MKKSGLLLSIIVGVSLAAAALGADSPSLNLARQLNQAFSEVAEKVSPSVVVITVHQKPGRGLEEDGSSALDSLAPELRRYFRRQLEAPAQGSGLIIRDDGYILTNGHVVEEADKIEVRLHDGRILPAKVRGIDLKSDVAVIKVEAKGLPQAKMADSTKTKVGEFAIAIGAPFSLDYTVTFGHVSAKGRSDIVQEDGSGLIDQDFLQTDALINPGNSGGPLVNIDGEVIGINTLIRGLHTGIGFAIPSNLAREISDQLVTEGKFTRAMLGVGSHPFREDSEAKEWARELKDGVIVTYIVPNGPAAKSELNTNDIITAVDGKGIATVQQLRGEIRGKKLGHPVTLDVLRQDTSGSNKKIKIEIKPAEWADPPAPVFTGLKPEPPPPAEELPPAIGVTVHTLTHELAAHYGVDVATDGVLIVAVEKGTAAARKGIKPGDIILAVNKQPVSSLREFQEALKNANYKSGISLRILSGKKSRVELLKDQPD